ncbi:MAG: hypothetical protein G01um101433_177 [Parcubacteria group bacterium Gr01-1014_33]|nr:MAG: hypothetical protein G01um101433_177 [Parcubacteria group bacterium Gr01-1014_33]
MLGRRERSPAPIETAHDQEEPKIIPQGPKLQYLDRAFGILRGLERDPLGEEPKWFELWQKVERYRDGVELADNIRKVVVDFIASKIPRLKEEISPLDTISDENIRDALLHNWFEKAEEEGEISGKRREILLMVMAHVVKRIENAVYKKTIANAAEEDLEKIGLNNSLRKLVIDVMDTAIRADPLIIRFMAYAKATPPPPKGASVLGLDVPGHKKPYTIASLFPNETYTLSRHFHAIAEQNEEWITQPGGAIFKEYLEALSVCYKEKDVAQAEILHKEVSRLYRELLTSEFPIVITPTLESGYKEPYLDPELRVSVATPDACEEELIFKPAQNAMAESLGVLGVPEFSDSMRNAPVRILNTFGGYGINLNCNAVAQERPAITMYLNEQLRSYDRDFPEVLAKINNTESEFVNLGSEERKMRIERMSRANTIMHEYAHYAYLNDTPESLRFGGRRVFRKINEIKAEILYRPLIPSIIEKRGLEGTKEQWAIALLAASFQMLGDMPEDDPYWHGAAYCLNNLFESGAVTLENGKAVIKNFDLYYLTQKSAAEDMIRLHQDPAMTERKAAQWIKQKCIPNEKVRAAMESLSL